VRERSYAAIIMSWERSDSSGELSFGSVTYNVKVWFLFRVVLQRYITGQCGLNGYGK